MVKGWLEKLGWPTFSTRYINDDAFKFSEKIGKVSDFEIREVERRSSSLVRIGIFSELVF